MITYKHYNNYNDFAEANNEDWLESYLYYTKPNASHDAEGINEAMPADEQEELREAIESKGLEQALEDIFGNISCVQIEGGHTGREEDTIWYYIN